jgi:hypothetical protein
MSWLFILSYYISYIIFIKDDIFMAQVMNKTDFCNCLETLRKYSAWENTLYTTGIDLSATPVSDLAEKLQLAMCGFNVKWSFDEKLEFDWIIEWAFNPEAYINQTRHGKEWLLEDAGTLYDFLVFMNDLGWED